MTKPNIATAQALLQVTMLLMRSFSANMRRGSEEGLEPAQVGILMHIGMQVCTLSELAEHLSVRLPTVSRSVSVLVNAGLIKRWTPENNRRISLLDLTIAGRKKLTSIKNLADQHVVSILAPLTSLERTQVDVALKNLIKVMKP